MLKNLRFIHKEANEVQSNTSISKAVADIYETFLEKDIGFGFNFSVILTWIKNINRS